MDAKALRLQHGAGKGAGATLAVGAGDMDYRRQAQLGIVEVPEEPQDAVQRQVYFLGMQRLEALHHRIAACGLGQHQGVAAMPPLRLGMFSTLLRGLPCFISRCSTRDRVARSSLR